MVRSLLATCCLLLSLPAGLTAQSIHEAAQKGQLETVRRLIARQPDLVRAADDLQRHPLHLAARFGRREVAAFLIERGADVDHAAYNEFTPLHLAAAFGQKAIVELLVAKGARLEQTMSSGNTALDQAAQRQHKDIVAFLRAKGARYELTAAVALDDLAGCRALLAKNRAPAKNWRLIWEACRRGHAKVAKVLLDHGAPTTTGDRFVAPDVSMLVPGLQFPEVVRVLLAGGADVDPEIRNYKGVPSGGTPLLLAAGRGYAESFELLVAHEADAKTEDDQGWTALHHAASGGHRSIVLRCLALGLDPRDETQAGWSPLALAARACNPSRSSTKDNARRRAVVDALAQKGAPIDLYSAATFGMTKRVRAILAAKQHRDLPAGRNLDAALVRAVKFGHGPIADLLCAHGANPKQMEGAYSLLHWAAFWNRASIVKTLLDRGVDPNVHDGRGFTPLHEAARLGSLETAQLLLNAGAKKTPRDAQNKRPIDWVTDRTKNATALRVLLK